MSSLDILKQGYELLSGSNKKAEGSAGNGIFGGLMDAFGGKPEVANEANEAKESAEKQRTSIWSEVGRSLFLRQFPRLAVLKDLGKVTGSNEPEAVPWQHEFEAISALLILVPNKWKHVITDMFANSSIFQTLVEHWPGLDGVNLPIIGKDGLMSKNLPILGKGGSLRDRILNEKDPDAVVEAIRIMHQDIFVTGKVTFSWVREKLGLGGALATLGGGAAAAVVGNELLGGGSGKSLIDKGKDMLGIGTTGKKILELNKAHPEIPKTKMQQNLLKLMQELNVTDSTELVKGSWENNNDEVTVSFIYNNAKYFLVFDNDVSSTDLILNSSDGRELAKFTDWGGLDAKDDAKELIEAIQKSPSPQLPAAKAANDNAIAPTETKKAA